MAFEFQEFNTRLCARRSQPVGRSKPFLEWTPRMGVVVSGRPEAMASHRGRGARGSSSSSTSEAHLHRYLAEFDFRANTRDLSDAERADALLAGAQGKRLLYRQPDQAPNA